MSATRWVWIAMPAGLRALAYTYVDPTGGPSAKGAVVPEPPTEAAVRRAIDHPDLTFRQPVTGQPVGAAEALRLGLPKDPPWIGFFERKAVPPPRGEPSRTVTAIVHRKGAPIGGARVRLGHVFGAARELITLDERVTDPAGHCEFPLAPLTEIVAIADLGTGSSQLVAVPESGVVELEVGLPGALAGVITKRGAPIAGHLSLTPRGGGVLKVRYTDDHGAYRIDGIVPDTYAVEVEGVDPRNHKACGTPTYAEITIVAGEVARGDYELVAGAQLDVRIPVTTKQLFANVYLFEGAVAPRTSAEVTALWRARAPATFQSAGSLRNDGAYITTQFFDVVPGHYTLTVGPDHQRAPDPAQPVACTAIVVGTEPMVIEVAMPAILPAE